MASMGLRVILKIKKFEYCHCEKISSNWFFFFPFLSNLVICSNIQNYAVRRDQKWARELFSKILDLMLIEFLYKTTKTATAGKYLANGAPNGIDGNAAGAEGSDFVDSEVDFRTLFISYLRELVFRCKPEHLQ